MVSKMVIDFFLGLTTMKLGEFAYRFVFYATYVVVAGLRVNTIILNYVGQTCGHI